MKKILVALWMTLGIASASAADKYSINRNDLPTSAQEFLTEYFPDNRVSMIKTDKHFLKKTDYDVKLVNGTKIEFDNAGKWTSIDCKQNAVPEGLIIRPIRNYVKKNFPETYIVSIEKKINGYEVELNDGIELKFNLAGSFKSMKMDD